MIDTQAGFLSHLSGAALDPDVVNRLRQLQKPGTELLRRVSDIYVEQAPTALCAIERAAKRACLDELARTAHALRSMSVNIGARYVAEACHWVEDCALRQEATDYARLVASVRRQLDVVLPEIAALS